MLSIFILLFSLDNKTLAHPVAVNVLVGGFGVPYSVGFLYCFSAALLFALTLHIQLFISLFWSMEDATIIPSTLVEHAPYTPK